MATLYGDNYTKEYVNVPSEKGANGAVNGHIGCYLEKYSFVTGALPANNDLIAIAKLPAGSRVIDAKIMSSIASPGTGTCTVGTLADPDAFIGELDVSAAAFVNGSGVELLVKQEADLIVYIKATEIFADAITGDFLEIALIVADC